MSSAGSQALDHLPPQDGAGLEDAIFDALATAVVMLDPEWRVISLSHGQTMLEASIERSRGIPFERLIDLDESWRNLLMQVQSEHFATVKMPMMLHSGAQYCVDLISAPSPLPSQDCCWS